MKSPLLYLTLTKLKNRVREFLRHPARLIYVLLIGGFLALSLLTGEETPREETADLRYLAAIVNLFYTLMLSMLVLGGSSASGRNGSMFSLSDAVLLFPSPLSPVRILFYGVLRQLGISLLLGVFLLAQYAMLHDVFGLSMGGLVLIVLGYGLTLFAAQLINMAVYARTAGSDAAEKRLRRAFVGLLFLLAAAAALWCREPLFRALSGDIEPQALLDKGVEFFAGVPGVLFPFSGWIAGSVSGILLGRPMLLTLLPLAVLGLACLVLLILRAKDSYYEEALQTAETAQSAVTAQKEGQAAEISPKKVRLGKTGLGKGWGASAIFYKHAVENRRSGRFLLSGTSLLFAGITVGASLFFRFIVIGDEETAIGLVITFAMGAYLQLFSVGMGRFPRELIKPYVYLIPEPPLKKLLWSIAESMVAEAVEAFLIFIPVGLITGAAPLDVIFCILARISFSLLYIAGNIAVERVFGALTSKVLTFFFYFLMLILLAVPGIILGVVLVTLTALPGFTGLFLGMTAANLVLSVLVLFLCRNVLQYPELS